MNNLSLCSTPTLAKFQLSEPPIPQEFLTSILCNVMHHTIGPTTSDFLRHVLSCHKCV